MRNNNLLGQSSGVRQNFDAYLSLFRELYWRSVPHTSNEPKFSVLRISARLELEDAVLDTIAVNPGIDAEVLAVARELLQVAMFDDSLRKQLRRRTGLLTNY